VAVKSKESTKPGFVETGVRNLIRYEPSGTYYARVRVGSKLKRKTLETSVLSVAKLRLRDFEEGVRSTADAQQAAKSGRMTFKEAAEVLMSRIQADPSLKKRSKSFYRERLDALLRSWPELVEKDIRSISKLECSNWLARFGAVASPSSINNTLSVLQRTFEIAVEHGVRYENPAAGLKRAKVLAKRLVLPEPGQFKAYVTAMRTSGSRDSTHCADLVEFLAYGGFRIGEAGEVSWQDCDFQRMEITVRGDPETGTKNWSIRRVPMIPDMLNLLKRIRHERSEEPADQKVMRVRTCQHSMRRAAKIIGIQHISHHDLRHLFATRCIESGVDIPTVARWLGHKDGGALAMKTYGHLRNEHSLAMAQKVTFQAQPTTN
jgi:integrase